MQFDFTHGVEAVGGFMNYAPANPPPLPQRFTEARISALGKDGEVLESYDLFTAAPIVTPDGVDAGAFRGIVRNAPDIFAFSLEDAALVITDLTFTGPPGHIDEPPTSTLFAAALVALGIIRRKLPRL